MHQALAVIGPTASGKSALGIRLAQHLGGEIISCDSMQIYQGMNVGTAKVTTTEAQGIPHHLLDICRPGERFTAADYQSLARDKVIDIMKRRRMPIFVGGTGLYLYSALYAYNFPVENQGCGQLWQKEFQAKMANLDNLSLWQILNQTDPTAALSLHVNDRKRILRALSYFTQHGHSITKNKGSLDYGQPLWPCLFFGLDGPRAQLYRRIEERVEQMLATGLIEEAKALWQQGLDLDSQSGQAIGYKQLFAFFAGQEDWTHTVAEIKQESRRYAKRQLTWFRRNPRVIWLDFLRLHEESGVVALLNVLDQTVKEGFTLEHVRDLVHDAGIAFLDHIGTTQDHLSDAKSGNTKTNSATD